MLISSIVGSTAFIPNVQGHETSGEGTLNIWVQDSSGNNLGDTYVVATPLNKPWLGQRTGYTDQYGTIRFEKIGADDYTVLGRKDGYREKSISVHIDAGYTSGSKIILYPLVLNGEIVSVNPTAVIKYQGESADFQIRVRNTGDVTAAFQVYLTDYPHASWYQSGTVTLNPGGEGTVTLVIPIGDVAPGSYSLGVWLQMAPPGESWKNAKKWGSVQVTVNQVPTTGDLKVIVQDTTNSRVSDAYVVSIYWPGGQVQLTGNTNSAGEFTWNNVVPGDYTIKASKGGYIDSTGTGQVMVGQTTTITLTLSLGGPVTEGKLDGRIVMASPTSQKAESGQSVSFDFLVENTGEATGDYHVYLQSTPASSLASGSAITLEKGSQGTISVTVPIRSDATPGTYSPEVYLEMAYQEKGWQNQQRWGSVQIVVTKPELRGNLLVVVKAQSGNPVDSVSLISTAQPVGQSQLSGITDSNGQYTWSDISPGSYTIQASKIGFVTSSAVEDVHAGQTTTINLVLTLISQPSLQVKLVANPTDVPSGSSTRITATVTASDGGTPKINYSWIASGGKLSSSTSNPIIWSAPVALSTTTYRISLTVSAPNYSSASSYLDLAVRPQGAPMSTWKTFPWPVHIYEGGRVTSAPLTTVSSENGKHTDSSGRFSLMSGSSSGEAGARGQLTHCGQYTAPLTTDYRIEYAYLLSGNGAYLGLNFETPTHAAVGGGKGLIEGGLRGGIKGALQDVLIGHALEKAVENVLGQDFEARGGIHATLLFVFGDRVETGYDFSKESETGPLVYTYESVPIKPDPIIKDLLVSLEKGKTYKYCAILIGWTASKPGLLKTSQSFLDMYGILQRVSIQPLGASPPNPVERKTITFLSYPPNAGTISLLNSQLSDGATASFSRLKINEGSYGISAREAPEYRFLTWEVQGNLKIAPENRMMKSTTIDVQGTGQVRAIFEAKIRFVTQPSGIGEIVYQGEPNEVNPSRYHHGEGTWENCLPPFFLPETCVRTLKAIVPDGYEFVGWKSSNQRIGFLSSTSMETEVVLTGAGTITAIFERTSGATLSIEQSDITISVKQKQQTTLISIKNKGDEPIHKIQIKLDAGRIKSSGKAEGWDIKIDQVTIILNSTSSGLVKGNTLLFQVVRSSSYSSFVWSVYDRSGGLISIGRAGNISGPPSWFSKELAERFLPTLRFDGENNQEKISCVSAAPFPFSEKVFPVSFLFDDDNVENNYENYVRYKIDSSSQKPTVYINAVEVNKVRYIQYWYYYPYNTWVNDHEHDWEWVMIELDSKNNPRALLLSGHGGTTRYSWQMLKSGGLQDGSHPVVNIDNGSHAFHAINKCQEDGVEIRWNGEISINKGRFAPWSESHVQWLLIYATSYGLHEQNLIPLCFYFGEDNWKEDVEGYYFKGSTDELGDARLSPWFRDIWVSPHIGKSSDSC